MDKQFENMQKLAFGKVIAEAKKGTLTESTLKDKIRELVINSLDEATELIQKVDPILLSEISLIANCNSTDPVTVSKLLAFRADKVMLCHDLEFAKESDGWENPNICQAIKNRSRVKVKHVCGIGDLKEGIPCRQIIEEYNDDLKQILFALGLESTEDFKEYALEHINLM